MIVQDPAAVVAHKDVVKLNQLKTNPFARLNLAEKYPLVVESQFKPIKVLFFSPGGFAKFLQKTTR